MIQWLLDLLFPPKCVFCHKLLRENEKEVCFTCEATLPEHDVVRNVRFTKGCVAPLYYEGTVRNSILHFKFQGCAFYAPTYGRMIARKLQNCPADLVTWVPVSRYRRFTRGYDQAELIAREVAAQMNLPCEKLLRKDHRPKQSRMKDASMRRANVNGAFHLCCERSLQGKRILLIDDICTTGSTMTEAALTLQLAGTEEIYGAVLAHTKT